MIPEDYPEQFIRPEDGLQADIWNALQHEDSTRSMDLGSLSIKVKNGEVYLNGYLPQANNLTLIESVIYSVVGVVAVHNYLQTNDSILAEIEDSLWKDDALRTLDMNSLSIEVKNGEVFLFGHLAQENHLLWIERIFNSMEGVVAIHNNLVMDQALVIQVAQALARDERTRPFILPVDASRGWINLGGEVPTRELQQVAEKVAAGVPDVRGIVSLPSLAGQSPDKPRHAVQPRIGAIVHGMIGEVGVITQVVIQPENRLVTHVVVRAIEIKDTSLVFRETVVPCLDIDHVNGESIFLGRNGPSLSTFPALDPDDYPLAPFTWKAPYPYTAGEVRWSLQEILEGGSRPSRPEKKPVPRSLERVMAHAGA